MNETEQILFDKYGKLSLTIREIAVELNRIGRDGKPADKSILNSISAGTFPIPTHKNGKLRVADLRDVAAYLDKQRQGGQDKHNQEQAA